MKRSRRGPNLWWIPFALLALAVHAVFLPAVPLFLPWLSQPPVKAENLSRPVAIVVDHGLVAPKELPEKAEDEPEEVRPQDLNGQLVDLSPPEKEEVPVDAKFLADHNEKVEEETRVEKFKVNPEIMSRVFSKEEKLQEEDLMDLNVNKPSTGATPGSDTFDPEINGAMAALPSKWRMTNKEGFQDPVPSAHTTSERAGAPQNDLLDVKKGDRLGLNTKEYLYNSYIQTVRRLVNFHWQQNLDNLGGVRLVDPEYLTSVAVVLDSDGALDFIEVTDESGINELDNAVVRAFKVAGPFPNPPAGLIEKDGRVYLPQMNWNVSVGTATIRYDGIDPRAGVQFPGILKSPR